MRTRTVEPVQAIEGPAVGRRATNGLIPRAGELWAEGRDTGTGRLSWAPASLVGVALTHVHAGGPRLAASGPDAVRAGRAALPEGAAFRGNGHADGRQGP
ncbi:hypothetical protein GCM10010271_38160 [Streptomyces kurssanovii]|nr:hypothetical protein GCM10010271_38160 [Streptomyces kurssanovii]